MTNEDQRVADETPAEPIAPISVDLSERELPPRLDPNFVRFSEAEAFERTIRGRQEWVRTALAVGAFLSLVVILLVLLFSVISKMSIDNIEKVSAVVVTPLTGIVGTIIGFYFAEKQGSGSQSPARR